MCSSHRWHVTMQSDGPKRRRGRPRKQTSSAGKNPTGDGTEKKKKEELHSGDLKKLHEELMAQIEERKKAQAELSNLLATGNAQETRHQDIITELVFPPPTPTPHHHQHHQHQKSTIMTAIIEKMITINILRRKKKVIQMQ